MKPGNSRPRFLHRPQGYGRETEMMNLTFVHTLAFSVRKSWTFSSLFERALHAIKDHFHSYAAGQTIKAHQGFA